MAVGLVVLFLEGTFVKLLKAECTHKVLWVKFTMHRSDAPACDRLLTAVAQCTSAGMIVHLTVRSAIMLKEASSWKSLMAFLERNNIDTHLISPYDISRLISKQVMRIKTLVNCRSLSWCYTKHTKIFSNQ